MDMLICVNFKTSQFRHFKHWSQITQDFVLVQHCHAWWWQRIWPTIYQIYKLTSASLSVQCFNVGLMSNHSRK